MHEVSGDSVPSGLVRVNGANQIVDANSLVVGWAGVDSAAVVGKPLNSLVQALERTGRVDDEYLVGIAEIAGSHLPVFVAEGMPDADGCRYLTLFDATEQRDFRQQLQRRHSLVERTRIRLELVIGASIAFADASSESELAEILAETTVEAYAAEEAVVFLLDEDMTFQHVAGTNPFHGVGEIDALSARALELRNVVKISGVAAAHALAPSVGAAFEATGVQAMIIAPIHQQDQPLGILAAFFHHHREFDEQASPLADALAGQAARTVSALRLQRRLEHAASHDDTTGLPNRRLLEERMDHSAGIGTGVLAVLFVDLDGFKNVNDQLGHQVGDEVLREVAARLQSTIRQQDVVARYGGDEFVIVCEVTGEDAALEMAERVRANIRAPYGILPASLSIGASIGVSFAPTLSGNSGTERLVRAADQAMYRAKYAGGNQIASVLVGLDGLNF
jgi:diguanylate cyclase (GGDEF)-like protein